MVALEPFTYGCVCDSMEEDAFCLAYVPVFTWESEKKDVWGMNCGRVIYD